MHKTSSVLYIFATVWSIFGTIE